jgi:hypothetical protein
MQSAWAAEKSKSPLTVTKAFAKGILAVVALVCIGGGASVAMASAGSSAGTTTVQTQSPAPIQLTPAQMNAKIAAASDPGLPSVVGSVNGVPIAGPELAQMEMILSDFTGAGMGSTSLRQQAFNAIVQQYVQAQAAQAQGFFPSMADVAKQAQTAGLPTSKGQLDALQALDGTAAMRVQYLKAQGLGPNDYAAWSAHVASMASQAQVVLNAKF